MKEIYTTAPAGNKELFLKWLRKKVFSEFYTQLAYDLALKTQGCDSDRLIMLGKKSGKSRFWRELKPKRGR